MPSQRLQHFSVESVGSVSWVFCSFQWSVQWDYRKVGLLVCKCTCACWSSTDTTAVPVKMKWRGSNRNSWTLEAGLLSIDKSHMHEKAFSNLLPFDNTEVNWTYTYRFYPPIPNVKQFPVFFLAIVTHAQAVDTKPSFLLPRSLGTRLAVPMHINSLACKISLWTLSDTCMR